MLDTQQTNNIVKADRAGWRAPGSEIEVPQDGHMRKQSGILKYQADATAFGRVPNIGFSVGKDSTVNVNSTTIGLQQASDCHNNC
jgi:hypothetical protein